MSDTAARAALARMNMRQVMVCGGYGGAALAADMQSMRAADPEKEQLALMGRRGELCLAFGVSAPEQRKPFAFAEGFAIIPVSGTLVNRFSASYGYITGYNFIRAQVQAALVDDDVKGIIFDVNSYGGEAAGCFELCADIMASRAIKPSLAVVDSNAYSAGYAIASAATKLVAIPSAGVGSIGVIMMHVDMSKMLDEMGVKISLIYEAEHKADGNPYEELPEDVRKKWEASNHTSYENFCAVVAAQRGFDVQVARDTKSNTFRAEDALSLGLIDAIESPSVAVRAFSDELSGSISQLQQEVKMTVETKEPGKSSQNAASDTAQQASLVEARTAERTRVSGIVNCEEAKGRAALANHLALNTDTSLEAAKGILSAAAVDAPAKETAAADQFKQAMDAGKHPNVGADGSGAAGGAGGEGEMSAAQRILASQALATGVKLDAKSGA